MMEYYDYGYGMGFFGWILMVLFLGAIIWLVVWLVNKIKSSENYNGRKTPLDILKERFAKGEITKKEYGEMKKEIM